jgi:hypothetical protein
MPAFLLLAAGVSAQTTNSTMVSMSTATITDCTDVPDVTLTSTNTVTITYCSSCEMESMGGSTVHTTVYTTVYSDFCPTATASNYMTPVTYTVTESCTDMTPTWSTGSTAIPPGFTVGQGVCTECGPSPVTGMSEVSCRGSDG